MLKDDSSDESVEILLFMEVGSSLMMNGGWLEWLSIYIMVRLFDGSCLMFCFYRGLAVLYLLPKLGVS